MQFSTVVFSALLVLITAQDDVQPWGMDIFAPNYSESLDISPSIGDFFNGLGDWLKTFAGPSFLRNVTRQSRQDYFKIVQNKTLTRAQLQSAIGSWATKNNVTAQVNQNNAKKATEKSQFRANVTTAVQLLPSLISQLNAIEDNQSLTSSQAAEQMRQLIRNASHPLRDVLLDVLPPSTVIGSVLSSDQFDDGDDLESSEDGDDILGSN